MIKKGSSVFAPDMRKFAIVIEEGISDSLHHSKVGLNEKDAVWQKDTDLVVISEKCDLKSISLHVLYIISEIAGFLWRRISALERENKELKKELNRLKEDVSQNIGTHRVH